MATVIPAPYFNAESDAKTLNGAMKGHGTDEAAIIDLLSHRSLEQRQTIEKTYKSLYGVDLKKALHRELSGYFRLAVEYSFDDKAHVNARALYRAMNRAGTDETILINVICPCTNQEIEELKKAYDDILREENQNLSRRSLEKDVCQETSQDFERVLVAMLQGKRKTTCDKDEAAKHAEELRQAGEAKWGTDEETFTKILVNCSWEELVLIAQIYEQIARSDLFSAIKSETSGDYREALLALLKTAYNRYQFYAEVLYNSMKGAGTRDADLVRMIMAHCDEDLRNIKEEFHRTYNKDLGEMVKSDTSHDQQKFLMAMLGECN